MLGDLAALKDKDVDPVTLDHLALLPSANRCDGKDRARVLVTGDLDHLVMRWQIADCGLKPPGDLLYPDQRRGTRDLVLEDVPVAVRREMTRYASPALLIDRIVEIVQDGLALFVGMVAQLLSISPLDRRSAKRLRSLRCRAACSGEAFTTQERPREI